MAGVPPPPRQLEVRRFAAARAGELRSLHAAVSGRLDGSGRSQQPRSSRRRTTGHLPSKRRRRSGHSAGTREGGRAEEEEERSTSARKQSRRVRRRRELAGNPAEGFSVAGDGARRLRTHLWHAKRFSMERRWGFVLPDGAQGRGRGSRSVLKRLKNATVVHDASYFVPIQLDGPEDSLLSILRMVLHPSPADKTPDLKHKQDQIMRGVCYESAMLWGVGSPHSQIVGPVTYMWRPFSRENDKLEPEEQDLSNSSLQRQLWIWIHPAALDEGLNAIRFACERQMHDSGGVVKCCSLEGKIARLEVMGCKAMQSLKSMLHPLINSSMMNKVLSTSIMSTSTDAPLDSSAGSVLSKVSIIDHAEILQPGAILSMMVHDPREVSVQRTDSSSKAVSLNKENRLSEEDLVPNADETSSEVGNILSSMWMHPGRHDLLLSDCRELWGSSHNINPPVAEEILCMEKHHERIMFFCLDSGNDQGQTTQEKDSSNRSCPVILLKHGKEGMLTPGWSIILPLSWVKPFWLFLVSHGAHAIGLRERRWIATKFKLPCFPYDYPDSKAYSSFMAKEAAIFDKSVECRPASKRPSRVPVPPLWHCIMACFNEGDGIVRGLQIDDLILDTMVFVLPNFSTVSSKSGEAEPSQANVAASLPLFVPRTIRVLRQYVKEIDMKYLTSSSDTEMDTDRPNLEASNGTVKMTCSMNELCLTRVLIRAFKEGSFEEGAVVCAPCPSDLSAWKIRSNEEEEECVEKWELQLPQSHVSSYFSWLDPSTSNLQLPKDENAREAFRWPIGFVTTGFVHGSNGQDAVAVAFCEVKLLAMLRRQQWTHENLQTREICVLVRNARSAAYRRALATIVLEQQEADLEFL
ncbi:ribonucleases P/MRP protein subunit POP1 isoform X2 [Phragmites australis]|uniref:ribonucleases P/MRP protein subunit POP1 isoform X2 n=1 Tax=Phragmites australis TaxID=29695 RepID=UPI002D7A2B8C|nr:ribonucleases P/MRP protein subunit POP1 isoform X2 [Phragmites australis]